ncbi:uncharacterized protein TNCV_4363071 [Trichonephila clavipes]|nr:uncharacterized protein TNCV_4363071 [Trichonephila clavipes]
MWIPITAVQCSKIVSRKTKSDRKTQGQGFLGNFSCVIWNKLWPDLESEKDFNNDHREEITDFVQSIPRFLECDEDVETWMVWDAEDSGFKMLNEDEIVTFPCKNPTLSTMKRLKTRTTTTLK